MPNMSLCSICCEGNLLDALIQMIGSWTNEMCLFWLLLEVRVDAKFSYNDANMPMVGTVAIVYDVVASYDGNSLLCQFCVISISVSRISLKQISVRFDFVSALNNSGRNVR